MTNRNGFYTSEDLKRACNMKQVQHFLEILPAHDGFTYVWLHQCNPKFKSVKPINPITQDEAISNNPIHLVNSKIYPSSSWKPIASSQEISVRWRTGDEISRHTTIEEILYWIDNNL
jgi:hypothetical protein